MKRETASDKVRPALRAAVAALLTALTGASVWVLWQMPREPVGLADAVADHLEASGVTHPVTAVLLDFRAYDTMLEVTVLVLVVISIWSLADGDPVRPSQPAVRLLQVARALLAPIMIVIGGYLLWAGTAAPGGAFQAGAVLSSAGVLLLLIDRGAVALDRRVLRVGIAIGLATFVGVGLGCLSVGRSFLAYPTGWAKELILTIEVASTISISLILLGAFAANPARLTGSG